MEIMKKMVCKWNGTHDVEIYADSHILESIEKKLNKIECVIGIENQLAYGSLEPMMVVYISKRAEEKDRDKVNKVLERAETSDGQETDET